MSAKILWYLNTGPDMKKNWKQTPIDVVLEKISANEEAKPFFIAWSFEDIGKNQLIDTSVIKFIMDATTNLSKKTDESDTKNNTSFAKDDSINKLSHENQINSSDEESSEEKQKTNDPINAITISTLIVSLISLIALLCFIFIGKPNDSEAKTKIEELKLIAENLKSEMETKTDGLKSISNNLNTAKTNVNASVALLKEYSGNIKSVLEISSQKAGEVATIAERVKVSLTDLNTNTFAKIGELKNLTDANLFNEKFTTILKETLSTEKLAEKIMEKDLTSGKKFITSLTDALLSKEKTDIDNLRKKFAEKLGEMTVEGKKALITGIINSYNQTDSETKNKLAQDLVKGLIDKGSLQQAIAKVVAPSKRKAIIIPTQDFNPATKDKALFIELMKKLLAKKQIAPDEFKVFIDRNGRLVEINEENKVNVLNENFNDVISNINGATINDFLNSTESKYDCIFIRGPDSSVKPEIVNAVWFNGNRCSVIYTVKGKVTNDDYPRLNQWRNLTILNQGKLRLTNLKDTESANDSADSIIKEIDGIN